MLKYTELVLQKVSFNKDLFRSELKKSIQWLETNEVKSLKTWCILNFGALHSDVINEVFK